jgi:glycosyltransferase involved in cell wall biosynthesis
VLQAMQDLPPRIKLRIIGYETLGSPTFLNDFTKAAAALGLLSRLDIIDALPRSQLLSYAWDCQVGLSLMPTCSRDRNEQAMPGASNKTFDYLACGLAVLVSDLPDWKSMFVEPGFGLSCVPGDAESISAAIRWFFENPEHTRAMGERGKLRVASEWNYETQFAPVTKLMRERS